MTADEVYDLLEDIVRHAGGMNAAGELLGLGPRNSLISEMLTTRREPGAKLLAALGLRRIVSYELLKDIMPSKQLLAHRRADILRMEQVIGDAPLKVSVDQATGVYAVFVAPAPYEPPMRFEGRYQAVMSFIEGFAAAWKWNKR